MLGTVDAPDGRQLTVADVPGLIEGASEGIGLGHEFLAHLERARLLLHVIDATRGRRPSASRAIDRELAQYGAGLDERPQIVVLNKLDLLPEPPRVRGRRRARRCASSPSRARPAPASRSSSAACSSSARPRPPRRAEDDALVDFLVYRPRPRRERGYRIFRTDRGFRVDGHAAGGRRSSRQRCAPPGRATGAEVEVGGEKLELA